MAWWLKASAKTILQLLHILFGVAAAACLSALGVWSVPNAADTIRIIGYVAMVVVVVMGIPPLLRAWSEDRVKLAAHRPSDDG